MAQAVTDPSTYGPPGDGNEKEFDLTAMFQAVISEHGQKIGMSVSGMRGIRSLTQAWDSIDDTINDVNVFLEQKQNIADVGKFFDAQAKLSEDIDMDTWLSNAIEDRAAQEQISSTKRGFWSSLRSSSKSSEAQCTQADARVAEMKTNANDMKKKFQELKDQYGTPELRRQALEAKANKVLEQHMKMQVVNLVISFGHIMSGFLTLKQNGGNLSFAKDELARIDAEYIVPITTSWTNGESVELEKIVTAKVELRTLSKYIEQEMKTCKVQAATHSMNAITQGVSLASSLYRLYNVASDASEWTRSMAYCVAGLEAVSFSGSVALACWSTYNWSEWSQLSGRVAYQADRLENVHKELRRLRRVEE